MRRLLAALFVSGLGANASANDVVERSRPVVSAGAGYGMHEALVVYRGTAVPFYETWGPAVTIHAGLLIPLGGAFLEVVRGGVEYRFARSRVIDYGMGGAEPTSSMTFLPFVEALTRYGDTYFVGLGPRTGLVVARATLGTGSSAENVSGVHPFIAARVDAGRSLGDGWDLAVSLGLGVIVRREVSGAGGLVDASLYVSRSL